MPDRRRNRGLGGSVRRATGLIPVLTRVDLQAYVDKRAEEWIDPNVYRRKRREKLATQRPKRNYRNPRPPKVEPPEKPLRHPSAGTIKKEIISLRTAWNWARRYLFLREDFPGSGLDYAKIEENGSRNIHSHG